MSILNDNQIFVIVDIEADGPVPGLFSMLSFGATATSETEEISTFYRKLIPLENASQYSPTMEWWNTQPEAWREVTVDAQPAKKVMNDFVEWLKELGKFPVFVSDTTAFDYAFISWYLWKFTNQNPFTDKNRASITLDLMSFISGKYDMGVNASKQGKLPEWMKKGMPLHSHKAIDDAQGYAVILRNLLNKP